MVNWKFSLSENKKTDVFLVIQCSLLILAFLVAPVELPKVSSYMEIYVLFFAFFASLLFHRTGQLEFSRLYPLAGLMVFVGADVWEWGIFIFGNLGIFNPAFQAQSGQWFDQIHRVYVLIVFYVLLRFSHWKPNRKSLGMMALTVAAPLIVLALSELPGFGSWAVIVRMITLFCLGFTIYLGVDSHK